MKQKRNLQKLINLLEPIVLGLEKHAYASELNKLHFIDGEIIAVPGCKTLETALNFAAKKIDNKVTEITNE